MRALSFSRPWVGILGICVLLALSGCDSNPSAPVEERLAQVAALAEQGKLAFAVAECKSILEDDPENLDARLALGRIYLQAGEGEAAEKELRAVAAARPESELVVDLALARLYAADFEAIAPGDAEQSLAAIGAIAGLSDADRARLTALHGQALLGQDKAADAARLFDMALAEQPADPYALLGQAMIALREGDTDRAREVLAQATGASPEFAPAWSLGGDIERGLGNLDAAEAAYGRAIDLRFKNSHDLFGRALTRIARGDHPGAREDAGRLARIPPGQSRGRFILGLLAYEDRDFGAAAEHLGAALGADDGYLPAVLYAGLTAAELGQNEQALELLRRYVAVQPNQVPVLIELAVVSVRLKDLGAARDLVARVLALEPDNARALELLGAIELAAGNPPEAEMAFAKVARQSPESGRLLVKLGLSLAGQGKQAEAREVLDKALDLQSRAPDPADRIRALLLQGQADAALTEANTLVQSAGDAAAYALLGQVQRARGELDQAAAALDQALGLDPNQVAALIERAEVAVALGQVEEAIGYLRRVADAEPKRTDIALARARLLAQAGRAQEAIGLLLEARQREPRAWQPRVLLARLYRAQGEADKALAELNEIAQAETDNGVFLTELGQAQLASGAPRQALETYQRLVALAPESAYAHYRLAELLAATGSIAESQESLETAAGLDPNLAEPRIVRARMALAEGDLELASSLVSELTEGHARNPDVQSLVGALAMHGNDQRGAIAAYDKVMATAPSGDIAVARALAQVAVGDWDPAIEGLEAWVAAHPDDRRVRTSLGNLALSLKRTDLAKAHYQTLVEQGAAPASVRNNLAQILMVEGDLDGALIQARAAIDLAPQMPELKSSLGIVLLRRGELEKGLAAFEQALALAPEDPRFLLNKAIALDGLGRADEAGVALDKALAAGPDSPVYAEARALQDRIAARPAATVGAEPGPGQ